MARKTKLSRRRARQKARYAKRKRQAEVIASRGILSSILFKPYAGFLAEAARDSKSCSSPTEFKLNFSFPEGTEETGKAIRKK